MNQSDSLPKTELNVPRLRIISFVCAIIAWVCTFLLPTLLNTFVLYAMGAADTPGGGSPLEGLIFLIPLLVCFGLSITLPSIAISTGRKAIKVKRYYGSNWKAWTGISLGAVYYLIVAGLVFWLITGSTISSLAIKSGWKDLPG